MCFFEVRALFGPYQCAKNLDFCYVWIIKSGSASPSVGKLSFQYPAIDFMGNMVIYEASLYLDSKNGKKIASILPGEDSKIVGLDFGYYYLYYRYSYDYGNNSEDVGWIELDSLGNALSAVINAGSPIQNIEVPIYYLSDIGRFGYLEIINQSPSDLKIFTQNGLKFIVKGLKNAFSGTFCHCSFVHTAV